MYDELLKRLRELHPEEFGDAWDFAFACQRAMHEAADAIEELSRENESLGKSVNEASDILRRRWIPVTERFPKIHTMVLVMDKEHNMAVCSLEKLWDGEVWVYPFADVEDEQCLITHWMPLPEPPKEE